MESSPEDSDGYDVAALLSGKQKLVVKPRLLYSMDKVRKAETDEAELCTYLWDKCEEQKVELARAMADLAKSNETVTMLKVRNAKLSRQVESHRKESEITEHRLQEMEVDGPMVPYDPNVRAYREALAVTRNRIARGEEREVLLRANYDGVENVHRWLDIAIPKGIASNLACKNNTFFNFAFQLAKYVFKQEAAQYFSRSGTTNASNGMDTLALPINILEGFLGLTAKLGHCYKQQLELPAKAQKGEEESDDADEGIRLTYAGIALSKWLTQLRNKYKSKRLPTSKVMQGKAVSDQVNLSVQ